MADKQHPARYDKSVLSLLEKRSFALLGFGLGSAASACSLLAPTDSELMGGRTAIAVVANGGAGTGGAEMTGAGTGGTEIGGTASGGMSGVGTGGTAEEPDPDPAPKSPALEYLSLWLRADEGLSTTSVRVSSWGSPMTDASPAYALTPETVERAPSLGPIMLGGYALPTFDGMDDGLQNAASHDFTSSNGYAFFVVLVPNSGDADGELLSIGGPLGVRLGLWKLGQALGFGTTDADSPRLVTEGVFTGDDPIMIGVVSSRPPDGELMVSTYVNGTARVSGASPAWDPERELSFTLGSFEGDAGLGGGVAEVLIYNDTMDDAARFGTEAYLRAKWGCCK
ncbi:MAG: hypothetical protein SFV15_08375 [Polyangiaceae bacterium]|nr:hypothetical protein [Polyangiaceae bacterium]